MRKIWKMGSRMVEIMGDDGDHMGSWEMEKPEKP